MPLGRPPPPLFPPLPLDPISENLPSDIISQDSSSSDSDTEAIKKRDRMLKYAESYLRGEPLYLHSAGVRGPVVNNPWAKGKKQTKRKMLEVGDEEEAWAGDVNKRLKLGQEDRGTESAPLQIERNAMEMWDRETNSVWDRSGPSTPTPLRTRPPEETNIPDRSHSRSHSPFEQDLLEFRTPIKKKPKAPIEVAPVFSPGTFYRPKPKPQQVSNEDSSSSQRRVSGVKKTSPPLELDLSAPKSNSSRKTRENALEVRDSTPRLRPRKSPPAEVSSPDTPTHIQDTTPRLRNGRKSVTDPIPEISTGVQDPGSKPRSMRGSARASEPEMQSATQQINTRAKTKSAESSQEARTNIKYRSTRSSSKSKDALDTQPLRQEQDQILDTIEVVPPPEVQSGDIDMKKKRPKIDFGTVSPFGVAPERPKARRKQRGGGGGAGKGGKRSVDAQTEEQQVSKNMDIMKFAEPEILQPVAGADAITYVAGSGGAREMVEIMNKEIDSGLVDTRVPAIAEPSHPYGNVEVTSEKPSIVSTVSGPEQEQVTRAEPFPSGRDLIEEAVLETWVNRHVAASQKFTADHNRISIANLLSPAVGRPVASRNTQGRENFAPDTPSHGNEAPAVPGNSSITMRPIQASTGISAKSLRTSLVEKTQSPTTEPHAITINVPRSPDQPAQSAPNSTHQKTPTQFSKATPILETGPLSQHESWQNTQHAVLAAQKGFFEAIQESPGTLGYHPSTTITPARDLLRPARFFEDENLSDTPANTGKFGNDYLIGTSSPFKTPGMENIPWTIEPGEPSLKSPRAGNFWTAKMRDGDDGKEALVKSPDLLFTGQSYREEETIIDESSLGDAQWTIESGPRDREESPPNTPSNRQLSPFQISFGSEESGTAFTPFHAFATPESSPKANKQVESPPNGQPTIDGPSASKRSVTFARGLFKDNDDERGRNDTISFSNDFSPVLGAGPHVTESLLETVKDFMGECVWDTVAEAQKFAESPKVSDNDTVAATPTQKGEKKEYMSARKRRSLLKKKT